MSGLAGFAYSYPITCLSSRRKIVSNIICVSEVGLRGREHSGRGNVAPGAERVLRVRLQLSRKHPLPLKDVLSLHNEFGSSGDTLKKPISGGKASGGDFSREAVPWSRK